VSGPSRRLFIGLLPTEAVRDAIVDHQARWYWGSGLPTRPARLHLTLHFLGAIDATREQALRDTLAGEDVAPFDLVLRMPECWSGGIAVLRPNEHAALTDLHMRLARRLSHVGIAPLREDFTPHVTLARSAWNAAPPEAAPPVTWTVRDFALVWSQPGPPARYEVLDRYGSI
jgi:2'-5' RNA ligase